MGWMKMIDEEMQDMSIEYRDRLVNAGVDYERAHSLTQEWEQRWFDRNRKRATDRVRGLIVWDMPCVDESPILHGGIF